MGFADVIAYIATLVNLFMLAPQVIRVVKTKHTKDLSLTSLILFLAACVLWLTYGIAKNAAPIIVANITLGVMNLILTIFKLKYK